MQWAAADDVPPCGVGLQAALHRALRHAISFMRRTQSDNCIMERRPQ